MSNNRKSQTQQRQNLYVTVTVILMMTAVIVAIWASLAKGNATPVDVPDTTDETADEVYGTNGYTPFEETEDVFFDSDEDSDTKKPETTDAPKDTDTSKTPETDEKTPETEKTEEPLPKFIAPVKGEILKGASLDTPVFSLTMEDFRIHTGVDIYCDAGADVAAAAKGTVKNVWQDPMMGSCISIEHAGGAVSTYMGLCDTVPEGIAVGKTVEAGQIIATAADTALLEIAEESHLHFELSVNGKTVDPCDYIEFPSESTFSE